MKHYKDMTHDERLIADKSHEQRMKIIADLEYRLNVSRKQGYGTVNSRDLTPNVEKHYRRRLKKLKDNEYWYQREKEEYEQLKTNA